MAEAQGAEGGNAAEIARKRPRIHQAFQDDEQKVLKKYEKIESTARKILSASYEKTSFLFWMDEVPDQLRYIRDRFDALQAKSTFSPIRIGLFGSTGAGKSTLLNTLLDRKFFLPVSGTRTCTSCQVQISTCRIKHYEANIFLLSEEEWKDELSNLFVLLDPENRGSESDDDVEHAIQKLQALYGEGAERRSYEELLRTKPVITIPSSRCITLRKAEAEELSKELDPYIRSWDHGEGDSEMEERKEKMRLWPLIKHVEVTLPISEQIPEGVVFVDIPGTGDSNKKRDEMWKESILECSSIWIIADVERVFGARGHDTVLQEAIKACQAGKCNDIAFVVTKIDNMNTEEYLRFHKNRLKSGCYLSVTGSDLTDIIMKALEREILLKKKTIYESLALSIQSSLSPHYDEAARICGKQACENIKNKLKKSVEEEVGKEMFEKAKEKMKSHFQDLKVQMTTKLEKNFSSTLRLAFCPWDRTCRRLPGTVRALPSGMPGLGGRALRPGASGRGSVLERSD
ncbi:nuclear GTPase SLIP-GC [Struthio camelus]|uniref:nuclear GTPase SLIP-GC n=1 Tax=Struthio camelus TaxID=8801 RepID=UPI0036040AD6